MPTLLLTGFEPFGGARVNPSALAAAALDGEMIGDVRITAATIPVSYARAATVMRDAIAACSPDAVMALGQAAGRADIAVERIAINLDDADCADNDGLWRRDLPIVPGAQAAYFASLPVKRIVAAMREAGAPASVSYSAGTFLCNHLFFQLCHFAAIRRPGCPVGFIHVPALPIQVADRAAGPSMALTTILQGLRASMGVIWEPDAMATNSSK
jgi:pyroglutamyl-peptidase